MYETIRCNSLKEAVELCENLKSEGSFKYFRGQFIDWPLTIPSLLRSDGALRKENAEKLYSFIDWAKNVPQMSGYLDDPYSLLAIAQHYGLHTYLLDITRDPKVAAFFSKTENAGEILGESVIYCYREEDVLSINDLTIIDINVSNLWRIESQDGLFFEIPNVSVAQSLKKVSMKIVFPSESITVDEKKYIYPERKSALETTIEQWFYRYDMTLMSKVFSGTAIDKKMRRQSDPGIFLDRSVPDISFEWLNYNAKWVIHKKETHQILESQVFIEINLIAYASLKFAVVDVLKQMNAIRSTSKNTLISFNVFSEVLSDNVLLEINKLVNRAWDGIRCFPYEADELINCMSLVISLLYLESSNASLLLNWKDEMFGEHVTIEVAPIGGHIDCGVVSLEHLKRCFNLNSLSLFSKYYKRLAEADYYNITKYLVEPWILFDFSLFKNLYIEQFVPSSIYFYWQNVASSLSDVESVTWSTTYNPALLGFVSTFDYRFTSPFIFEKDLSQCIYIHPDMTKSDIKDLCNNALKKYNLDNIPYLIKFTGYDRDEREAWEIDTVITQCRWFIETGGIAILDFSVMLEEQYQGKNVGFAAFEVWLIGKKMLNLVIGKPNDQIDELIQLFSEEWNESGDRLIS